ncbi:MAG: hypothetical protein IMF12_02755 [Proteobacteria bacterium]|nr:hypothetical protein [Pseudomonadota bacterium]
MSSLTCSYIFSDVWLNEDVVKYIMTVQRKFKDKFGVEEYKDIVTESKLLPNNWADVFKKLTPP